MTTTPPDLPDAMARLWAKFKPEIERRVAVLESAAEALSAGTLDDEQRATAHEVAHKLAGSLGTFGRPHGTELARQAELALADRSQEIDAKAFSSWVLELRSIVNS